MYFSDEIKLVKRMKRTFFRTVFVAVAVLCPAISFAQVAGSGQVIAPRTGRNCYSNSRCATVADLKATIPLNALEGAPRYLTTAGGPGGDVDIRPVGAGDDPGWSLMMNAIPIVNFANNTVTFESIFMNRSSNRDRYAALEVPYTVPRGSRKYITSSGYVHIAATGHNCTDNGCATRAQITATVPDRANISQIEYLTTAENGPNNDDINIHAVNAGECAWCFFETAVVKTLGSHGTAYQSNFFNRSSDRGRWAALVIVYTLP